MTLKIVDSVGKIARKNKSNRNNKLLVYCIVGVWPPKNQMSDESTTQPTNLKSSWNASILPIELQQHRQLKLTVTTRLTPHAPQRKPIRPPTPQRSKLDYSITSFARVVSRENNNSSIVQNYEEKKSLSYGLHFKRTSDGIYPEKPSRDMITQSVCRDGTAIRHLGLYV